MSANYPILLINFYLYPTATYNISSDDIYVSDTLYSRRLLNAAAIEKRLTDIFGEDNYPADITLEFANGDGYFTSLQASEEFRGKGLGIRRYDINSQASVFQYYGKIKSFSIGDIFSCTVSVQDPNFLQTTLPKKVLSADDFISDRPIEATRPAQDNGKSYQIVIGHAKKVPLRYLKEDHNIMKFYNTTIGGGGECYVTWKIWAGSYIIQSGDYLEYDVYCDENNPEFVHGMRLGGSTWDDGTSLDQNGINYYSGDIQNYAKEKWYSRKVNLTSDIGRIMTRASVVNHADIAGDYNAYYRNIRITDGAGATRLPLWLSGDFNVDELYAQSGTSDYGIAQSGFYDYLAGYGPIASTDKNKTDIHMIFNISSSPTGYLYVDMSSIVDYTVQSGDYLEYEIYWPFEKILPYNKKISLDFMTTDSLQLQYSGATDQNGLSVHPQTDLTVYAANTWYKRVIALPTGWIGKTIAYYDLACHQENAAGDDAYIRNIKIRNGMIRKNIWSSGDNLPTFVKHLYSDPANTYDFSLHNSVNVYRSKLLISQSAYKLYDGTQPMFNGYAFFRFYSEQRDFSGGLYELTADFSGLLMSATNVQRNPIRVIQNVLSNSTWGCSQTVNAASFNSAAACLIGQQGATNIYMNYLLCDGALTEQRKLIDILTDLKFLCRADLDKNENGEWIITIDKYTSSVSGYFGDGDGYYDNIIKTGNITYGERDSSGKTFNLKYGYNGWQNEYIYKNTREVFPFGEEINRESPFLRHHLTSDIITSFIKNKLLISDKKINIIVGSEGKDLQKGNIIAISIPRSAYTIVSENYLVREKSENLNATQWEFALACEKYAPSIYDYTTGTMPTDAKSDEDPDYTNTPPDTPTNFIKVSENTYQSSDGTTFALFEVSAKPPVTNPINFSKLLFGYRKNGETIPYTYVSGEMGITVCSARIDGLIPGLSYDLVAVSENQSSLKSEGVTLAAQVAPGDTTAPATPTGLTATGAIKQIKLAWNDNTENDIKAYEIYRHTTNNPNTSTKIATVGVSKGTGATQYIDEVPQFMITYYYWLKAVDFTGNKSGFSTVASAQARKVSGGSGSGDISSGSLGTIDMANNIVTYIKRQVMESQSHAFNIPGNDNQGFTFVHSMGRKVSVTPWINLIGLVSIFVENVTTTSFVVVLCNLTAAPITGTIYADYW